MRSRYEGSALIQAVGIHAALEREDAMLHLNANENAMSPAAWDAYCSPLAQRYMMSTTEEVATFGRNAAFVGMPELHQVIEAGASSLSRMLGTPWISTSPLSGVHAMMCAIFAFTDVGDTIMSVPSNQGGHFATARIVEAVGRSSVSTVFDQGQLNFDLDRIAEEAARGGVDAIYFDTSVLLQMVDVRSLRKLLPSATKIIVDISHTLGLVLGGALPNPLDLGADLVCGSTHKTFPGPQKGFIALPADTREFQKLADVNGSFVSSVHTGSALALAVALVEFEAYGPEYARQTVLNANALADSMEGVGFRVRRLSDGRATSTHQVHCFLDEPIDRRTAVAALARNNIAASTSGALGTQLFLRVATQEVTALGCTEKDMPDIADLLRRALADDDCRDGVEEFLSREREPVWAVA